MTPILVRPVREQLEHDRVIRLLQARWRRKYTVGINVGAEQTASVALGDTMLYPDLVLTAPGGRRPEIIVEVETGESVNNLEALAEWVRLARIKAEFHLYVPAGSVDVARRLCQMHDIPVAEICSYHPIGDQMRWITVDKTPPAHRPTPRRDPAPAAKTASHPARAAAAPPARPVAAHRPAANGGGTSTGAGAHKTTSRRVAKPAAAAPRARAKKAAAAKPARTQKRK